jgi:hypothetical protein
VSVTAAPVSSITVSPVNPSIAVGATQAFTATVVGTGASSGVTWRSSNPTVAAINTAGTASAVAAGTTTITAVAVADTTFKATTVLTVTAVNPCARRAYTVGTTMTGQITSASCTSPNRSDWYTLNIPSTAPLLVTYSATFEVWVEAFLPAWAHGSAAGQTQRYLIAGPVGANPFVVWSSSPSATGTYSFSVTPNTSITTCITLHTTFNTTIDLNIPGQAGCVEGGIGPAQQFYLQGSVGRTLTVTVTSSAFQPLIQIMNPNLNYAVVASTANAAASSTATMTHTLQSDFFIIRVAARNSQASGSYRIVISP